MISEPSFEPARPDCQNAARAFFFFGARLSIGLVVVPLGPVSSTTCGLVGDRSLAARELLGHTYRPHARGREEDRRRRSHERFANVPSVIRTEPRRT